MIVQNCRTLFDHYNNFVVVFTSHQTNGNTHALPQATLSHASRNTYVIPPCIANVMVNETP